MVQLAWSPFRSMMSDVEIDLSADEQTTAKALPESERASHARREARRVLQVNKYQFRVPGPDDSIEDTTGSRQAESSKDVTLTALAQLAALRLSCRRATISLVDTDYEYILAEATQTLSLVSDSVHSEGDELVLGTAVIRRNAGVTGRFFNHLESRRKYASAQGSETGIGRLPVHWISDLHKHEYFKNHTFIQSRPELHFYATVPLQSPSGHFVGALSVYDENPRENITSVEHGFLHDLSIIIMEHMESVRGAAARYRSDLMVNGLSEYLDGRGSLRSNWRADQRRRGRHAIAGSESVTGNHQPQQFAQDLSLSAAKLEEQNLRNSFSVMSLRSDTTASTYRPVPLSRASSFTTTGTGNHEAPKRVPHNPSLPPPIRQLFDRAANIIRETLDTDGVLFLKTASSFNTTKQEVSGYLDELLSGSETDPNHAHLERGDNITEPKHKRTESDPTSSLKGDAGVVTTTDFGAMPESASTPQPEETPALPSVVKLDGNKPTQSYSQLVAWSTQPPQSLTEEEIPEDFGVLRDDTLRLLLRRYAQGKVFVLEGGRELLSSSDAEGEGKSPGIAGSSYRTDVSPEVPIVKSANPKRLSRKDQRTQDKIKAIAEIQTFLVGVRCCVFIPLWDVSLERWFGAAMIWTRSPNKIFAMEDEFPFLTAFGLSIMSDVARVEAALEAKTKSSFMSSISHELRSPLHAILASVEYLKTTPLNPFQTSLLQAAVTSGNTMLSVVNHVLDFSKLNSVSNQKVGPTTSEIAELSTGSRSSGSQRGPARRGQALRKPRFPKAGSIDVATDLDLSLSTEQAVDGCLANLAFQGALGTGVFPTPEPVRARSIVRASSSSEEDSKSGKHSAVAVFLNIAHRNKWGFITSEGAWSRIVLNLVGNALKYTSAGEIVVSLDAIYISDSKRKKKQASTQTVDEMANANPQRRAYVRLTVKDSGKGIDEKFLKGDLYKPFKQEDPMAPGSGLGLSIVWNIVSSMGGTIHVESTVGVGSEFTVKIPMIESSPRIQKALSQKTLISNARSLAEGKVVGLRSLETGGELPRGLDKLQDLLTSWFGCKIAAIPESQLGVTTPDRDINLDFIVAIDQISSKSKLGTKLTSAGVEALFKSRKPMILVSNGTARLERFFELRSPDAAVSCVLAPYGPHKIAGAICEMLGARNPAGGLPGTSGSSENSFGTVDQAKSNPPRLANLALPSKVPHQVYKQSGEILEHSPNRADSVSDPSSPKIMLVEDNPVIMSLLSMNMKKLKLTYFCATNGLEAVNLFKDHLDFDIILMDISMPIMNGIQASRKIRRIEEQQNRAFNRQQESEDSSANNSSSSIDSNCQDRNPFTSPTTEQANPMQSPPLWHRLSHRGRRPRSNSSSSSLSPSPFPSQYSGPRPSIDSSTEQGRKPSLETPPTTVSSPSNTTASSFHQLMMSNQPVPCTIVAITAAAEATVAEDAIINGVNQVLTKPVKMENISKVIKQWREWRWKQKRQLGGSETSEEPTTTKKETAGEEDAKTPGEIKQPLLKVSC